MCNIFFIHSFIDGHPGCFWFRLLWTWLSNALSWDEVSFGYTPKTYVCTQILGAQHWLPLWLYRFALPPTMDECCPYPTCQQELSELSLVFLILAVLTSVRWNLKAVLIRISPRDLRMLSISLFLGIWLSSVESPLFRSAPPLLIELFSWHLLSWVLYPQLRTFHDGAG